MPGEDVIDDGDVIGDPNPPPPPPPPPPGSGPVGGATPSIALTPAAGSLDARLAALEERLTQALGALARIERLRELERALRAAGAADVALALPLVERELAEAPTAATDDAVAALRQKRPGLFRGGRVSPGAAAAPTPPAPSLAGDLAGLALRAATGDPRAVRDYLRARRGE